MVDEIFDRAYQQSREELHASLGAALSRFSNAVGNAFEVLNRIEYSAPWSAKVKRVRCH
jgi:hypothetical protein